VKFEAFALGVQLVSDCFTLQDGTDRLSRIVG